jgi:hypothetical protein
MLLFSSLGQGHELREDVVVVSRSMADRKWRTASVCCDSARW